MNKLLLLAMVILIFSFGINAEGASIKTKITFISIWDVIIFQGEGFHRLHNVQVSILKNDVVVTTLITKTTDRGDLFMPLIISNLDSGQYDVFATDTIHNVTTSFEI